MQTEDFSKIKMDSMGMLAFAKFPKELRKKHSEIEQKVYEYNMRLEKEICIQKKIFKVRKETVGILREQIPMIDRFKKWSKLAQKERFTVALSLKDGKILQFYPINFDVMIEVLDLEEKNEEFMDVLIGYMYIDKIYYIVDRNYLNYRKELEKEIDAAAKEIDKALDEYYKVVTKKEVAKEVKKAYKVYNAAIDKIYAKPSKPDLKAVVSYFEDTYEFLEG